MRTALVMTIAAMGSGYAATAHANQCNAFGVHISASDVPLGCPVMMIADAAFTAHITVTHYDPQTGLPTEIDVTGAVTQEPDVQVPVEEYHYHGCNLLDDGPQPTTYHVYEVALKDVAVGDVLATGAYDFQPHVVAAAPCPAFVAPALSCADPIMNCDAGIGGDAGSGAPDAPANGGGCNAGGGAGSAGALMLLALGGRRRRYQIAPCALASSPSRNRAA